LTNESGLNRVLDKIWRFFSSVKLTIVILLIMGFAMGYGTIVETFLSNGAARITVYRTWWFDALIVLLALNLIGCTLRRAPYRPHQIPWLLTHVALLLLMAGSLITHRFGVQGQMVILEGETENTFSAEELDPKKLDTVLGQRYKLPFNVHAVDFKQVLYPGSGMTRLFKTHVIVTDDELPAPVEHDVILNDPFAYKGYKISQSSWIDLEDGRQATVLGVSYDPGIPYLYVGGILLVLAMLGIFFAKPWLKKKFPVMQREQSYDLPEHTEMTAELDPSQSVKSLAEEVSS
jgi:cytochrome c biogenesis protein ResB